MDVLLLDIEYISTGKFSGNGKQGNTSSSDNLIDTLPFLTINLILLLEPLDFNKCMRSLVNLIENDIGLEFDCGGSRFDIRIFEQDIVLMVNGEWVCG